MPSHPPMVEFDGRTYIMVERETRNLTQPGDVVTISRREVEEVLAQMHRRIAQNFPGAKKDYAARIAAYEDLLAQAGAK